MNSYDDQFKAVVLGALFHDIGKFYQRADENISYKNSVFLSYETKKNIDTICPNSSHGYSHKHALWTFEFFKKYNDYFRTIFKNEKDLGENNLTNLASYHHNPSTELQILIQQADWFSSGMDRTNIDEESLQDEKGRYNFRFTRLRPIFEEIVLEKNEVNQKYKYEIRPLELEREAIFPKELDQLFPPIGDDLWQEYLKLWNKFETEFVRINSNNFYYLIDCYLSLLEKYTWCIPSSTHDMPDISLFDHLKTTAAIASCLYRFHKNYTFTKDNVKKRSDEKFLLLGGDLSGIQKYIFDLTNVNLRKVSKTLRARSFYLSVLPKVLITKILFENGLTATNSLMETGGRFILLLPNTNEVKEYLEKLQIQLGEWCLNEFYGELTIGLDWSVTLNGQDFMQNEAQTNPFINKIDELNRKLEIKKLQKYSFKTNIEWEDNSFVVGIDYEKLKEDTVELCRTCGKKPSERNIRDEEGESIQICKTCYQQQLIGKELTHKSVFSIQKNSYNEAQKIKNTAFHFHIGETVYSFVLDKEDNLDFPKHSSLITAFALDKANPKIYLPRHLIANYVPRFGGHEIDKYIKFYRSRSTLKDEYEHVGVGQIKTFNDLAIPPNQLENPEDKSGTPYLAIIKADVDNLGLIFSQGIRKRFSISRYATLSRMFNTFFCGYLNTLLEKNYSNIYTVYAGGDDLFLIGNWLDIINFAPDFNNEFKIYTCHNADVHLSAGIELVKRRSPVRKGAEIAEEALEEAKSITDNNGIPIKNAFNLFNSVLNWEDWNWLQEWVLFFDEKLQENKSDDGQTKINSAFLYRLLGYQQMALKYLRNQQIDGLLYLSHLSYDIARNIQTDKNPDMKRELEYLQKLKEIHNPVSRKIIENIHVPIFYALYKNRGGQ